MITVPVTCAEGVAAALLLQTTAPVLNEPALQDGWAPEMVYPRLQRRMHDVPDAKVLEFSQARSRAPFWGTDRPVTVQLSLRGTHAIEPEVVVPAVQDDWVKEMVYPLLHVSPHEEPCAKVLEDAIEAAQPERAPFWIADRPATVQC